MLTDATGSGTSTLSNAKFEFEDGIKTGGLISTRVPLKWDRQAFVLTDDLSGAALTYSMT